MQQFIPSPKPSPAHVLVDHRERESRVVNALRNLGAEVSMGHLRAGDYRVDNRLLVERKTIRDLGLSVMSGRLFRQARGLTAPSAGRSCIIVEGSVDDSLTGGLSRSGFHGTLISLTLVFGLPVLRSNSPDETASLILLAARQLQRRQAAPPRRHIYKTESTHRTRLLMLQSINKVGPLRSQALLSTFGSPAKIAAATCEQIASVPGIGPTTAKRITTVMNGKSEEE